MTFRGYLRRRSFSSSNQLPSVSVEVDKDEVSDGPSRVSLSVTSLVVSMSMPTILKVHSEQFSCLGMIGTVTGTTGQKVLIKFKKFLAKYTFPFLLICNFLRLRQETSRFEYEVLCIIFIATLAYTFVNAYLLRCVRFVEWT